MIDSEQEARAFAETLCDREGMERLERLVAELAEENRRQNLVARNTLAEVWQRHVADSAQLLGWTGETKGPWLDLGSGAGFPGIVIAAMRPEMPVILVESRRGRIDWLQRIIAVLGLENARVEGKKLEQVETFPAAVISARAFAPMPRLLALSARFSTSATVWVLPKGRSAAQELQELPAWAARMFHVEQSLTSKDAGVVVGNGQWRHR